VYLVVLATCSFQHHILQRLEYYHEKLKNPDVNTTIALMVGPDSLDFNMLAKPSQLDGDYFQPNPHARHVAQPENTGVMWNGKSYVPIPHGVAIKMPQYRFVLSDGSMLTNPVIEESAEDERRAPGIKQFARRRRTALPDDELLVPAKFVTKDFVTTQDTIAASCFLVPEGTVLGSAMTSTGPTIVKPGFIFPLGTIFNAGAAIPMGTVVPAGTLFKMGTRIPDTIHLHGSAGLLSNSWPPSPADEVPVVEDDPVKRVIADSSSMDDKRALLEELRRRARTSSGMAYDATSLKSPDLDVDFPLGLRRPAYEIIGLGSSDVSDDDVDSLLETAHYYLDTKFLDQTFSGSQSDG
jgi:hypothetical protein